MLDKDYYAAVDDYNKAIITGIVKIAAKMGISTIQSYQGSKIFEAIGIAPEVIDKYFTGTVSRIGGITLKDIENDDKVTVLALQANYLNGDNKRSVITSDYAAVKAVKITDLSLIHI